MTAFDPAPDTAPGVPASGATISPSSLGVFFALNQCQRFLRLALMTTNERARTLTEAGVAAERIPPVLSFEGGTFEATVEAALREGPIRSRFPLRPLDAAEDPESGRTVVERLRRIEPGSALVFGQDTMSCEIGHWSVSGKPDVVLARRGEDGRLSLLVCDIKASREPRLEHRLQVALYVRMLRCLLPDEEVDHIEQGVIYRLPANPLDGEAKTVAEVDLRAAHERLGIACALLSVAVDTADYDQMLDRVLLGDGSLAERTVALPLDELDFHVERKCDVCTYNELCLKRCRDVGDLSLVPYIGEQDKRVLRQHGVTTVSDLAAVPAGDPELHEQLRHTWPVGARLKELTERASSYLRWQKEDVESSEFLTERGYSTLPAITPAQHPNLIQIFVDAQLYDPDERLYMVGALVRSHRGGMPVPGGERRIVKLLDHAPRADVDERGLLTSWLIDLLQAIRDLAAPIEDGGRRLAPIHLYLFEENAKVNLLGAIQRNADAVLGVESLFRLLTQRAAYETGNISIVSTEIERQWNLPMLCQSLQAAATFRGFRWDADRPLRKIFRHRFFDQLGKVETQDEQPLYAPKRSRFKSDIPIEYAYLAWGASGAGAAATAGSFAQYGSPTLDDLRSLAMARLDALSHIVAKLKPNTQSTKSDFDLAEIAAGASVRPGSTLQAMRNFVVVERHTVLNDWRATHVLPARTRVLRGNTLIGAYRDIEQDRESREKLKTSWKACETARAEWDLIKARGEDPGRGRPSWSIPRGTTVRLSMTEETLGGQPGPLVRASNLKVGTWVTVAPLMSVDTRVDAPSSEPYQTTGRQLMLSLKGEIAAVRDEGHRHVVEVELKPSGGQSIPGFTFSAFLAAMPEDGGLYSLDEDPSAPGDANRLTILDAIEGGLEHPFAAWLDGGMQLNPEWPPEAQAAQDLFFAGVLAFTEFASEPDKARYISGHSEDAVTLVQGPPGTGKSFTTAYAVLARIQGAMAAELPYVAAVSCVTHAATNVVLEKIAETRESLAAMRRAAPERFAAYFDERLLAVPVIRWTDGEEWETAPIPFGCRRFVRKGESARVNELVNGARYAVVGGTPGKIRKLGRTALKDKQEPLFDLCVIDEASQMSAPDALQATVGLKRTGRAIFVGDHRQMPPIVKHDWDQETATTFDPYAMHRSIFDLIREERRDTPHEKFSRSFRLHRDVAEYLRREIYEQDGIPYHSELAPSFDASVAGNAMVEAVLNGGHPLVVIRHGEAASQQRNELETAIVREIYLGLEGRRLSRFEQDLNIGVVVPHRAQRAEVRSRLIGAIGRDEVGEDVDTVERFQGGEREVIIVSATESDPAYLRAAGDFLFDPRRLTVAISRAKHKLIVIAAKSVFDFLPTDNDMLRDTALWRNLLQEACRLPLWQGDVDGHRVEVFGNAPLERPADILG